MKEVEDYLRCGRLEQGCLRPEGLFESAGDDEPAPPPRQLDLYQDNDEIHLVRKPWAWLVRHVFADDVSVCPKCDGPMRWVEVATEPDDIARLLAHHDRGPPPAPRPRGPPSGQSAFAFANGT